jgi:hypothetical protein
LVNLIAGSGQFANVRCCISGLNLKISGFQYWEWEHEGSWSWNVCLLQEKDEKLEGDAALNKLFREIYGNADEDEQIFCKFFFCVHVLLLYYGLFAAQSMQLFVYLRTVSSITYLEAIICWYY